MNTFSSSYDNSNIHNQTPAFRKFPLLLQQGLFRLRKNFTRLSEQKTRCAPVHFVRLTEDKKKLTVKIQTM